MPASVTDWWVSVDAATASGVVIWEGDKPRWLCHVWPNSTGSKWKTQVWDIHPKTSKLKPRALVISGDDATAWGVVWSLHMQGFHTFVTEDVYGPQARNLGERQGVIRVFMGCWKPTPCLRVKPGIWRAAVIHGSPGDVWPPGRDLKKAYAIELAKRVFMVDLPDDVADAYLIGKWFLVKDTYEQRDRSGYPKRVRKPKKPDAGCRVVAKRRRKLR